MADIRIWLLDGSCMNFRHTGRAGGSYTKRIRYEGDFAIVTDEWGKETAIPASRIARIEACPHR